MENLQHIQIDFTDKVWSQDYCLDGTLIEDNIWRDDICSYFEELPRNVFDIWMYGISEMINNAID
ncbi:MAG: hypothetical protein LBS55_00850, partial [Prevotellaceae bacterium]|nr:hypothetical protein [Prevotellaceae bacterium]